MSERRVLVVTERDAVLAGVELAAAAAKLAGAMVVERERPDMRIGEMLAHTIKHFGMMSDIKPIPRWQLMNQAPRSARKRR